MAKEIVRREYCVGFGLWTYVPQGKMHPTTHAQRVLEMALAEAKAQRGAPVSIRTTHVDREGVTRSVVSKY